MSSERKLNETEATKECYNIFTSSSCNMPKRFINFRYRNNVNFEEFSALCKNEKNLYKNTLKVIEYLNTNPEMLVPDSEKDNFIQWNKEFDKKNIYMLWSLEINNMLFPLHGYLYLLLQPLLKANVRYFIEALKKINNISHLNLILDIFFTSPKSNLDLFYTVLPKLDTIIKNDIWTGDIILPLLLDKFLIKIFREYKYNAKEITEADSKEVTEFFSKISERDDGKFILEKWLGTLTNNLNHRFGKITLELMPSLVNKIAKSIHYPIDGLLDINNSAITDIRPKLLIKIWANDGYNFAKESDIDNLYRSYEYIDDIFITSTDKGYYIQAVHMALGQLFLNFPDEKWVKGWNICVARINDSSLDYTNTYKKIYLMQFHILIGIAAAQILFFEIANPNKNKKAIDASINLLLRVWDAIRIMYVYYIYHSHIDNEFLSYVITNVIVCLYKFGYEDYSNVIEWILPNHELLAYIVYNLKYNNIYNEIIVTCPKIKDYENLVKEIGNLIEKTKSLYKANPYKIVEELKNM